WADRAHHGMLQLVALVIVAAATLIAWEALRGAQPALRAYGWRFLVTTDWDPVAERFGALPYLYGTAVSSFLALLLAIPFGLGTATYLAELAPRIVGSVVAFVVELLASIPSIVYGLWGLFVLAPFLRSWIEPWLSTSLRAPGATMARVIANEFPEATGKLHLAALIEIALVLLAVTVVVNAAARLLVVWSTGGRRDVAGAA